MEMGQNRFCQRVFFRQLTKLAKLGDLSPGAFFGSYKGSSSDNIEVSFPHFCHPN